MPRKSAENSPRLALRIPPADKALLLRAAALKQTDLTHFVLGTAMAAARETVEQAEKMALSPRDSLLVLDLLENPPPPNAKLMAAANALPTWR